MKGQLLEVQKRLQANLGSALEACNAVLTESVTSTDFPPTGIDNVSCLGY